MLLPADDAAALCRSLGAQGIRFWVVGGWGVDALFGTETRPHKDLDVLVMLPDLPKLLRLLAEGGFTIERIWEENRWLESDMGRHPSAFVSMDSAGRALDVHVVDAEPQGALVQLYEWPWPLPATIAELDGGGTIAGQTVPCASRAALLAMHTGYDLPETHQRDLARLRGDG